ncbi:hypothetical protein [Streptomyces sp. enrichment culture]|uniref:hypothetical protein n=1 Tax=Streptomyces sp. enrichment culture TaxID=1795815 RepID=UPI003F55791D
MGADRPAARHRRAGHRGHYADPAARETATGLLPQPVRAHAALLSALARLVLSAAPDELAVAARLAAADPEATAGLATLLARGAGPADPAGSPT